MSLSAPNIPAFVIALTGGIASGKTAVSDAFSELGVAVVDTDVIAREVVLPGSAGLKEITDNFGTKVMHENGALDRRTLRNIIFADTSKRQLLESILHPLIRTESIRQLQQVSAPLAILVIPLLAEGKGQGNAYQWVDRVLLVDVDEPTQIQRLAVRDDINEGQAQVILNSQANRQQRLAIADEVIVNDKDLDDLKRKVELFYKQYLITARQNT